MKYSNACLCHRWLICFTAALIMTGAPGYRAVAGPRQQERPSSDDKPEDVLKAAQSKFAELNRDVAQAAVVDKSNTNPLTLRQLAGHVEEINKLLDPLVTMEGDSDEKTEAKKLRDKIREQYVEDELRNTIWRVNQVIVQVHNLCKRLEKLGEKNFAAWSDSCKELTKELDKLKKNQKLDAANEALDMSRTALERFGSLAVVLPADKLICWAECATPDQLNEAINRLEKELKRQKELVKEIKADLLGATVKDLLAKLLNPCNAGLEQARDRLRASPSFLRLMEESTTFLAKHKQTALEDVSGFEAALSTKNDKWKKLETDLVNQRNAVGAYVLEHLKLTQEQFEEAQWRLRLEIASQNAEQKLMDLRPDVEAQVADTHAAAFQQLRVKLANYPRRFLDSSPEALSLPKVTDRVTLAWLEYRGVSGRKRLEFLQAGLQELRDGLGKLSLGSEVKDVGEQLKIVKTLEEVNLKHLNELATNEADPVNVPSSISTLRKELAPLSRELSLARGLLLIWQTLLQIPTETKIRSREALFQGRELLASADSRQRALPMTLANVFRPLLERSGEAMKQTKTGLDNADARLTFQEELQAIQGEFTAAASWLGKADVPRGRELLYDSLGHLGKLQQFRRSKLALQDDSYQVALQQLQARHEELAKRALDLVRKQRLEAHWERLPLEQELLLAPTLSNAWIQVERLVQRQKWLEATQLLDRLAAKYGDAAVQVRIMGWRSRVLFETAVEREARADFSGAADLYWQTADTAAEPALVQAAQTALARLESHQIRLRDEQRRPQRLLWTAGVVLLAAGFAAWVVYLRSPGKRIKRIRNYLRLAETARLSNVARHAHCLRQASRHLALLSDEHPNVVELRRQLLACQAKPVIAAHTRKGSHPCVSAPDPHETMQALLRLENPPSSSLEFGVRWLRDNHTTAPVKVRRQVLAWLEKQLVPEPTMTVTELRQRTLLSEQVGNLGVEASWPARYEFRARLLLGEYAEALQVGRKIELRRLASPEAQQLVQEMALCSWQLGRLKEAKQLLKKLPGQRRLSQEAEMLLMVTRLVAKSDAQAFADQIRRCDEIEDLLQRAK